MNDTVRCRNGDHLCVQCEYLANKNTPTMTPANRTALKASGGTTITRYTPTSKAIAPMESPKAREDVLTFSTCITLGWASAPTRPPARSAGLAHPQCASTGLQ